MKNQRREQATQDSNFSVMLEKLDAEDRRKVWRFIEDILGVFEGGKVLEAVVNSEGKDAQISRAHKEIIDLLAALAKYYEQGRVPEDEIIDRIASVQVMLDQLALMFGRVEVIQKKAEKLDNLEGQFDETDG